MNIIKVAKKNQGATNMIDIINKKNIHLLLAMNEILHHNLKHAMKELLHRHLNTKNVKCLWPTTMVSRVRMTLRNKDVVTAILLDLAIAIVHMDNMMITILNMSLANAKSVLFTMTFPHAKSVTLTMTFLHAKIVNTPMSLLDNKTVAMISHNTTTTSQVMRSTTTTWVMVYTNGDMDVHSHLPTVERMMTT